MILQMGRCMCAKISPKVGKTGSPKDFVVETW